MENNSQNSDKALHKIMMDNARQALQGNSPVSSGHLIAIPAYHGDFLNDLRKHAKDTPEGHPAVIPPK